MKVEEQIHTLVGAICFALDLEPRLLQSILVTPDAITAIVYRLDAAGEKYLEDGEPAVERLTLKLERQ